MNEGLSDSMLSLVANTLCCELREKFIFAMPRVVPDQRATFENDELFRKLGRESEVKYTGFRDRPMDERQIRFQTETREGRADIAFVSTGTNLQLNFVRNAWSDRPEDRVPTPEFVNFDLEPGKVHLKSQFILNGVCVVWRGWVDLDRLDGVGCLEFDEERAEVEDALLREQIEQNNRRVQEFEERRRQRQQEQERQAASEAEARSRRKSRPRKDKHSFSSLDRSRNTTTAVITATTNITTSPSATVKSLEAVALVSEPKSPSSKSERSPLTQGYHPYKSRHNVLMKADRGPSGGRAMLGFIYLLLTTTGITSNLTLLARLLSSTTDCFQDDQRGGLVRVLRDPGRGRRRNGGGCCRSRSRSRSRHGSRGRAERGNSSSSRRRRGRSSTSRQDQEI